MKAQSVLLYWGSVKGRKRIRTSSPPFIFHINIYICDHYHDNHYDHENIGGLYDDQNVKPNDDDEYGGRVN